MASIDSVLILIGGVGLGLSLTAWYLSPDKKTLPRSLVIIVTILVIGNCTANLGSIYWGNGNWVLTFSSIFWIVPAIGVMFLADERIFPWFVGFALIHGLFIILAGPTDGLTFNRNVASGLLVLAGIISIYKRYPIWIPILLLLAVGSTQSRWALMVYSAMVLAGCLNGRLDWRWLLGLVVGVILLISVTDLTYRAHPEIQSTLLKDAERDIAIRLSFPDAPDLLPHGLVEHPGLHNVPLRMSREAGSITAAIWVAVSVWALTRKRGSVWWWLMLGVVSLSMLDHYTWRPHLGTIWFLALGGIAAYDTKIRKDVMQ